MTLLAGVTEGGETELARWLERLGNGPSHSAGGSASSAGSAVAFVGQTGPTGAFGTFDDGCLAYVGAFQRPLPPGGRDTDPSDPAAFLEWLVERYRRDGVRFLDGLVGQYVLAVIDRARDETLLAADPYGARKLFVHQEQGRLSFSSLMTALARCTPEGLSLDRSLEDCLLGFEFLPWERTPLAGVKYLRPGTLIRVTPRGITRERIAPAGFPDARAAARLTSEDALIDALDAMMRESVLDQAPAGQRIGVLLGGVDSALIAAYLVRAGREVETFTFRFEESRYNQAYCDDLAAHLGIRHNWVPITPAVIRDGLAGYSGTFNQISAIPHYVIETAHACRAVRDRGITHCLTGDGCDEIFLGYPSVYRRARLFMRLPSLPGFATKALERILASRAAEDHAGHVARFTRNYLHILGRPWPARGHISNRIFDEYSLERLRTAVPPPQDASPEQVLETLAQGLDALSPLRLAYHGKSAVGLNRIKLEGSARAAGVSVVSPYQHPRMSAFGSALPESLLRNEDAKTAVTGKYILFRAIERRGYLPREIVYQRKASPVNAPVDYWYMGELRPFILDTLHDLPFAYDATYVERMLTLKRPEEWFRSKISLARSIFHPVALLATYANLHRTVRGGGA